MEKMCHGVAIMETNMDDGLDERDKRVGAASGECTLKEFKMVDLAGEKERMVAAGPDSIVCS